MLCEILSPWNGKILILYRHFHEWLPSVYQQLYRKETCRTRVPTFAEWVTSQTINEVFNIYTTSVINRYQEYFDDVVVLNFHNKNFLQDFFCKLIPNASHACDIIQKLEELPKINERHSLTYEIMAYRSGQREAERE